MMIPMLRVSFWGWVDVEMVVAGGVTVVIGVVVAAGVVVAVAAAAVVGGGRSRGAGTGGTELAVVVGVTAGTAARGWCLLARLPVRMLQRLSDELLRPDWLLASLPWSCWSRYVSWADSVLLCNVTEIRGLEVVRGGTGGGAFLLLTADRKGKKRGKTVSLESFRKTLANKQRLVLSLNENKT